MELLSNITEAQLEVIYFLNRYTKGSWIFNSKTGLVDIEGDFICCHEGLKDFKGVRFGVVTRYFYCGHNYLTSLEGAPQEVGGDFHCSYNKLTSLVGAPQKVGRGFGCYGFDCSNNQLTSLEGAPFSQSFYCSHNGISEKTLKLVWETMQEKKIDYWTALVILKSEISASDLEKLEGDLDKRLPKDSQKGISMMNRFRHFD